MSKFYNKLKTELINKGLSEGSINLYLRNLKKLNNNEDITNLKFLNKPSIIMDKIKDLKDNTKRQYLISIVTTTKCLNNKLYDKYYKLMMDIYNKIKQTPTQEKSETQKKNWMEWDEILKIYKDLEDDINKLKLFNKRQLTEREYNKILSYVILSLYVKIQPRRNKDWNLMVISANHTDKKYNYFDFINKKFIFNNYKTSKKDGQLILDIPDDLYNILMKYLKIHPLLKDKQPIIKNKNYKLLSNVPLLVYYDGSLLSSVNAITRILNKIFNKNISSSMLRHIYLSSKYGPMLKEQEEDAKAMSHSLNMQKDYIKS